jgi:carbon-monoxide dehydrogenase catalytic subunit
MAQCGLSNFTELLNTAGSPPVLHLGSCVDNSRILLAAAEVVKACGLSDDISERILVDMAARRELETA